jgi:hypothetical protein
MDVGPTRARIGSVVHGVEKLACRRVDLGPLTRQAPLGGVQQPDTLPARSARAPAWRPCRLASLASPAHHLLKGRATQGVGQGGVRL